MKTAKDLITQKGPASDALSTYVHRVYGKVLTTVFFRDEAHWIVKELGEVLGYSKNGTRLGELVSKKWARDFIEGVHYTVLRGDDLKGFRRLLAQTPSGGFAEERFDLKPNVKHLMVLKEPGLHRVTVRAQNRIGTAIQRLVTEEILPQYARDGRYSPDREVRDGQVVDKSRHGQTDPIESPEKAIGERDHVDDLTAGSLRWLYSELRGLNAAHKTVMADLAITITEKESGEDLTRYRIAVTAPAGASDFEDEEPTVERPATTAELARQTVPAGRGALERAQDGILLHLREHGPSSWKELIKKIEAPPALVKAAIGGLFALGCVENSGKKKLALKTTNGVNESLTPTL